MAILRNYSNTPTCEVEINITMVNTESVRFRIDLRFGPSFSSIHTELLCLKRDFLKLLVDLKQLEPTHLSMLEPHDPGLCIYHIPHYGQYFVPDYGIFQIPEDAREEEETRYKLLFVLDAYEMNKFGSTECGPALCLIVTMEQIHEFANSLHTQVMNYEGAK